MKYLDRCGDQCNMFLVESKNPRPHWASLRCRKHGHIKWLSRDQYSELLDDMQPTGLGADFWNRGR